MSFLHHTTVFISSHRHSVAVWHWAFRLYPKISEEEVKKAEKQIEVK